MIELGIVLLVIFAFIVGVYIGMILMSYLDDKWSRE